MKTLAIYCAGGLGREVLELARSAARWDEILFVDDVTDAAQVHDARVLRFADAAALGGEVEFVIANGEPAARKALYEKVKAAGYPLTNLFSGYAWIPPRTQLAEGCLIMGNAVLSIDVTICQNVLINGNANFGHDVVVGPHSVISHGCFVGGNTHIGTCVYMAPGALAKDRLKIGDNAVISLGAVLLRNVRPGAVMIGNPARHLTDNAQGKVFGMFDG